MYRIILIFMNWKGFQDFQRAYIIQLTIKNIIKIKHAYNNKRNHFIYLYFPLIKSNIYLFDSSIY